MGRMKELLNDEPADLYGPGYSVFELENAIRNLDKFTTEELAAEVEGIKAVTEYLEIRMKKIIAREALMEARKSVPF
jgi:hypothetical protein